MASIALKFLSEKMRLGPKSLYYLMMDKCHETNTKLRSKVQMFKAEQTMSPKR